MRRALSIYMVAMASAMLIGTSVTSAEGFTTRIETRPYYGAVTTLEHGVRVIRPLPPERYVIINPNRTPLALSFSENNVYDMGTAGLGGYDRSHGYASAANPDGPIYTRPSYRTHLSKHRHGSRHMRHRFSGKAGSGYAPKGAPGAIGAH